MQTTPKLASRRRRLLALACVCLSTVFSAPAAHSSFGGAVNRAEASHEIAFDFTTRQLIVSVKVNGGPRVLFVVDTGASIHLVDREIARQAGVVGGRPGQMSGGGQASVQARFVEPVTFEAGGLVWDAQRAAVTNLGYPHTKHFAGLLGAPILMRYTVRFAFETRTLRLLDRPLTHRRPAPCSCPLNCRTIFRSCT